MGYLMLNQSLQKNSGGTIMVVAVITLRFSSCWVTLRPAVFAAARIWLRFPPASGGCLPRLLPSSGGWAYCLAPEAPLIRGIPTGPNVFLAMPGACGLRPCATTHQKKALCHTCTFSGACKKYGSCTI